MRTDTSQYVFEEAAGAAVPTSSDSGPPEPESGALEVEVGGADCAARRHGRPSEVKGLAQRIRHANRGPRPGMDSYDVLGHRNVKETISILTLSRDQGPVDTCAA